MRAISETATTGWPLAATLALVLVRDRLRAGRWRASLNRGLHELRRPLQALALLSPGDGAAGSPRAQLELARLALADLDRAVNGTEERARPTAVSCRPLVEAAVERWRAVVEHPIEIRWAAGSATLLAEPPRVAQALDNLIANALEHGRPPVRLAASVAGDRVRIAVRDGGQRAPDQVRRPATAAGRAVTAVATRARGTARRGHGLRVVAEVAAAHGGRFAIQRSPEGTIAILELPLANPGDVRVA